MRANSNGDKFEKPYIPKTDREYKEWAYVRAMLSVGAKEPYLPKQKPYIPEERARAINNRKPKWRT